MELSNLILVIPIILAITLHEAAHGYVALRYGDDTALRLGRVTLNPLKHVDLVGTILLPGLLLWSGAPFLFGYAKPVPVDFSRLYNPRRDMVWVAAAGPLTNIALAVASALLFHTLYFFPVELAPLLTQMLTNSLLINLTLALFNMIPLPPLDGGRVAVGLLPDALARPLADMEPYGMFIIIGLIAIPAFMGFSLITFLLKPPLLFLLKTILFITGVQ